MDIPSLQAFVAVAESGSFSQSAEQLYLTQPAVSKRIAQLEQELNNRLFDRIGRLVTLTEAGQALLPRAKKILEELEDSKRVISNLSHHVGGRLSMATSHHIGLHRMPPILQSYAADFPEVELDLHFMASEEACQAILHGALELAVVTLPLLTPKNLEVTPLWIDPLCFVCGHQHPLAKQTHWDTRDLVIHTAILPGAETTTRQILENTLAGQGIKINTGMSTNYLETIRMMVSIGLGWSLLPQSMLDNTLCELRINSISLKRTLGIIKHRERTLSNAASKIIEKLKEYHSNHDV